MNLLSALILLIVAAAAFMALRSMLAPRRSRPDNGCGMEASARTPGDDPCSGCSLRAACRR